MKIETDGNQRELSEHGSVQFPVQVNHDFLGSFDGRYIKCHWHEDIEIPVVLQGRVRYQLGDRTFELGMGEGVVVNSRVPHSYAPVGEEEPVLLTTIFHPSFIYGTPSSAVYQKLMCPYMNTPELAGIRLTRSDCDVLKRIDWLYGKKSFGYELEIKGMLCTMFFGLLSRYEKLLQGARPSNEDALERLGILLDAIHERYSEQLTLAELASEASISKEGCCRFFKKMTGKTLFQYLEDYRISQGILLLQKSKYSITQVAYMVGFGNPGRFSAAFAKQMGCTPRQYRQRLASNPSASI